MSSWPEQEPPNPEEPWEAARAAPEPAPQEPAGEVAPWTAEGTALHEMGPPLFQAWAVLEEPPPERIPHFGHLLLLLPLALLSLLTTGLLMRLAIHLHLFGVTTLQGAITEIHFTLGSEVLLYVFTFGASALIFPLFWHKSLLAGLQWNGATALRLRRWLVGAAFVCFLIALLNSALIPGPANTPIEKIFRAPGAAWLLFGFGITIAPFFEEMIFRGFLLPALCTGWDWSVERITGRPMRPLGENQHPQWSLGAMVAGSILTSLPFAGMHAAQTGYSFGPFLLLISVSLVLCAVRLWTRSLAASVLVHAAYNFMLFSIMMVGTGGFRHFEHI